MIRHSFGFRVGVTFVGLFLFACNQKQSGDLGSNTSGRRGIYNGTPGSGGVNMTVGVFLNTTDGLCTGTLLCRNVVLTAKHCAVEYFSVVSPLTAAMNEPPANYTGPWPYGPNRWVRVVDSVPHGSRDLRVAILDRDAALTAIGNITPPKLGYTGALTSDLPVKVVGYGRNVAAGGAGTKRSGTVAYKTMQDDFYKVDGGADVTRQMVCSGDSGGPASFTGSDLAAVIHGGSDGGIGGAACGTYAYGLLVARGPSCSVDTGHNGRSLSDIC